MSDHVTISREMLEALVELADGCGYSVCPYNDDPVDERLVPTRRADLEVVSHARELLAAAESGCIADLCTEDARHFVRDHNGELIGLCPHHFGLWQGAAP